MTGTSWGILGTGAIARGFAADLKFAPGAELRSVGSRSPERAREFASATGALNAYGSYEGLLADSTVDIVYVATPPSRHKEDMLAAIAAGKHVLCEKPFTLNATEAREVAAAARANNRFCMEAMWMRFLPAFREAHQAIENGILGRLIEISVSLGYRNNQSELPSRYDLSLGGGALLDRGVYGISLAHALLGAPDRIEAVATIGQTGVDEQTAVILGWENGKLATITASLLAREPNTATIIGADGAITLRDPFYAARAFSVKRERLWWNQNPAWRLLPGHARMERALLKAGVGKATVKPRRQGNGYCYQAIEAMRCVATGLPESPLMALDESIAVMDTMDQARARLGLRFPQEQH